MADPAPTAPADVAIGAITLRGPGLDGAAGERLGHAIGAGLGTLGTTRPVELGAIHVRVSSIDDIVPAVLRAARRSTDG